MRILMIHASEFSFHVTEETSVAAAAGDVAEEEKSGSSGDSLVCFLSVEKKDEDRPGNVVAEAKKKILAHQGKVNAETLWLYPYAHLSSDLASPRMAQKVLKMMWQAFDGADGVPALKRAPFGYYKAFDLKAKGHPLSENALTVTGDDAADAADEDAGESKAVAAEKKLRSKFYFVTPEGEEIPDGDFKLKKYPVLRRFHGYETAGTRTSTEEPPHVRLMRQHELVDYEPGSDAGNFRWYPKGLLIKSLMEERINDVMNRYGAMRVETPIMYDYLHPNLAKYLDRFPARQYVLKSEKKDYFLRFAACFGQYLIKHDAQISYRQLPSRLYELTHYSFRREQSGELAGLRRLRTFTMPDMHTLCRDMDQAKEEFARQFDLSLAWMNDMGLPYATAVRVVKSFYDEHKDFVRGLAERVGAERPVGGKLVAELHVGVRHRDEAELRGRQPERERSLLPLLHEGRLVLQECVQVPLDGSRDGRMQDERGLLLAVLVRVVDLELAAVLHVDLDGGERGALVVVVHEVEFELHDEVEEPVLPHLQEDGRADPGNYQTGVDYRLITGLVDFLTNQAKQFFGSGL